MIMMRRETRFVDLDDDLIIVNVVVVGPWGPAKGRFVLDTGAGVTTMEPKLAASIGYGPHHGFKRTTVHSATGVERGYVVRVAEFGALGFSVPRLPINVFALGHMDIHGLVGMNFLSNFNYEVRSAEQRILVEKIAI
jgi:predicted aspartyl protease